MAVITMLSPAALADSVESDSDIPVPELTEFVENFLEGTSYNMYQGEDRAIHKEVKFTAVNVSDPLPFRMSMRIVDLSTGAIIAYPSSDPTYTNTCTGTYKFTKPEDDEMITTARNVPDTQAGSYKAESTMFIRIY